MYVDVHAHLLQTYYSDVGSVIARAETAGVKNIICAGLDATTNQEMLSLGLEHDSVKPCFGIYPIQKEAFSLTDQVDWITQHKKECHAISEVGLDYHWEKGADAITKQKQVFSAMIALAEKLSKPIIVHTRSAEEDCISMLASSRIKHIILHCFCGSKKSVKSAVDKGWFLTAPTSIVRSTQFQDNVLATPITQLFCETDSPYLAPQKDQTNEPAFVVEAYKKVAEIKKMELTEVKNNIFMNYQKVFT